MKRLRTFIMNGLLLGASSVFMRTVSVVWNAYVAARIGAEGVGLFSLIMSVYLFAVTFASAGINLAVTRLVARELAVENEKGALAVVRKGTLYALGFGVFAFVVLFFGADFFAARVLRDTRTALSLRAFSVSLPFIAVSNVYSGYFTAVRRVYKNAATSIVEQFCKIGLTVLFLFILSPRGMEYACLALVLGSCLAEALSFFYLFILYRIDRKKHLTGKGPGADGKKALAGIPEIALPIALSSYLRSGLVTVEHILIPRGLQKHGADYAEALSAYGVVHGMAIPLIYFPLAVCTTFASLIIPELSELDTGKVHGNRYICYIIRRSLKFAALFSVGTAGIYLCFAGPLSELVYPGTDAGRYVRILAAIIPVSYLDTVVDGMLKGLGEQLASMRYNIIDAAVSVALVTTLLPLWGVTGYLVCVFVCEVLNFSLSIGRLFSVTGFRFPFFSGVAMPILCIAGATSLSLLCLRVLPPMGKIPFCIVSILLSVLFYVVLLAATGSLNGEERRWVAGMLQKEK